MEKDKLFVLDVCGAYSLKDIEKLDRSEINEPARDNGADLPSERREFLISC